MGGLHTLSQVILTYVPRGLLCLFSCEQSARLLYTRQTRKLRGEAAYGEERGFNLAEQHCHRRGGLDVSQREKGNPVEKGAWVNSRASQAKNFLGADHAHTLGLAPGGQSRGRVGEGKLSLNAKSTLGSDVVCGGKEGEREGSGVWGEGDGRVMGGSVRLRVCTAYSCKRKQPKPTGSPRKPRAAPHSYWKPNPALVQAKLHTLVTNPAFVQAPEARGVWLSPQTQRAPNRLWSCCRRWGWQSARWRPG